MIATLALLGLAALAQAPPSPPADEWMLCQTHFWLSEEEDALVNLILDGTGRVQDNELLMSADFEAEWQLGLNGLAGRRAMTGFYHFVALRFDAVFPVSLRVDADGRRHWTATMEEPNTNNGDGRGGVQPMLLFATQPGNPFPNIHGVRRLRFIAVDSRGRTIADAAIRLPDWQRVDRKTRYAMRRNDQARRAHRCGPLGPL